MKKILPLLLCSYLAKADYDLPDISYDQTQATCDNAQTLVGVSTADLARLKYATDVVIPTRIHRLAVSKRATQKLCDFDTGSSMLFQKSRALSKVGADQDLDELCGDATDAIDVLSQQLEAQTDFNKAYERSLQSRIDRLDDVRWTITETCNLVSERLVASPTNLLLLQKKSHELSTADGDLDQTCQDVTSAIDKLSDYLEFVQSSVQSDYVEGKLPDRIQALTQKSNTCSQSSLQSNLQASLQAALQSSLQDSLQTSLQKSLQDALQSSLQDSLQTSLLKPLQSAIQSSITVPTPQIVRLVNPAVWSFNIPYNKVQTVGNYYYKVSLTKDTLIECIANGHGNSNGGNHLMARFFVDESPIGTVPTNGLDTSIHTFGMYLTSAVSGWVPINLYSAAIVPKGDHTISLRAESLVSTGGLINGLEVVLKIYS